MDEGVFTDPECTECGLRGKPIPDDGGDYTILAVGEAPGEQEVLRGKPFVGPSGNLLRTTLDLLGYPKVTYTNIVRCRPPNNKMTPKYVRCCYRSLPIKRNTKLVLLLGNTPLKAVLGETGITMWNGVTVEKDGIIYAPVYHPAYVLRDRPRHMDAWLDALDNALDAYSGGPSSPGDADYTYHNGVYTKKEVLSMCRDLMEAPIITFDTEVAKLSAGHPENRMLVMSFATATDAWAVPIDHPDDLAPINDDCLDWICNVLEQHPCIIGHNIKFDQKQMFALLDCWFAAGGDSMLLSFMVESKAGLHGLKRLAGYYLNMFDYDEEVSLYLKRHIEADPERGGSFACVPLSAMLPYAAKDAAATFMLHSRLLEELSERQQFLYNQLIVPTSNCLADIEYTGMAVDHTVAERYLHVYEKARHDKLTYIMEDPKVKTYDRRRAKHEKKYGGFNPASWQHKAMVLYGSKHAKWLESKDSGTYKHYSGRYYGLAPLGYSDGGNPSTKREYIEPYSEQCTLVNHLVMYSVLNKMLGTYIEPIVNREYEWNNDGRIHTHFNLHIVETGRLSSNKPNIQNIPDPKRMPGTMLEYQPIKNMFTHTWEGGCLMAADYAGMELRVFASLAHCEDMLDIHRNGLDFHTIMGAMISGKDPDEISVTERRWYKAANFCILYWGSAYTLSRQTGVSVDDAGRIISGYLHRFPEVAEYRKKCVDFTFDNGYIETPFGNRRLLPDINSPEKSKRRYAEREAVNTPVQGAAGLTTLMAMVVIDRIMRTRQFQSKIINTVHDSIVFDVYPRELDPLAKLVVDVMENLTVYAKKYMPDISMDWLLCPLKADIEVGSHYGCLDHYDVRRV